MILGLVTPALGACLGSTGRGGGEELEPEPTAAELLAARSRARVLAPAIAALESGALEQASTELARVLAADGELPEALALSAVVRWIGAARALGGDLRTVGVGAVVARRLNTRYLTSCLETAHAELAAADALLAKAARGRVLSLELCPACWAFDWTLDGRRDARDEALLEVETDPSGAELPDGDPRRRPTFAFDRGDLSWARAMLAFQRSLLEVALAYRLSDLEGLLDEDGRAPVTLHLERPARMHDARASLRALVDHSRRARLAYLAEQDDDREWVPSPRQRDHAIPLAVDAALYSTWEGVLGDLDRLIAGEDGVPLGELEAAFSPPEPGQTPPEPKLGGFLDLGMLLGAPQDVVIDPEVLRDASEHPNRALASLFGAAYREKMTPSPLAGRLARMQREVDAGQETWSRKLRYLVWLN